MTTPAPGAHASDLGVIDAALLRTFPLPETEARGSVLVVGGSVEMPGALLLAGLAALRSGVSKLAMATARPVQPVVAVHVPQARVYGLDATRNGAIDSTAAKDLTERLKGVGALLLGPGMIDGREVERFVGRVVARLDPKRGPIVVLDGEAMLVLQKFPDLLRRLGGRAIVMPQLGELASMLGMTREDVRRDPIAVARQAAKEWRAVVAVKGTQTIVVSPDGRVARSAGYPGVAASGAGDTLAGVVAAIASRGLGTFESTVWAVHLHSLAADAVAKKVAPIGFLARELLDEVPRALVALEKAAKPGPTKVTLIAAPAERADGSNGGSSKANLPS